MIPEEALMKLYVKDRSSVKEISEKLGCSESKINYWLAKYAIKKRTIAEAVYNYKNPHGDPFMVKPLGNKEDYFLLGLGIGLYWGEGTKSDKNAVRLGNSDPYLIKTFMFYLESLYGISKHDCSFGLQVFDDCNVAKVEKFWQKFLQVSKKKFYKTIIKTKTAKGSYKRLVEYGVLTVYFNNTKLRNILVSQLENIREMNIITDVLQNM